MTTRKRPIGKDGIKESLAFEPEVDYVKALFDPPPVDTNPRGPFKDLQGGVNFACVRLKEKS